jgi:hypothetical protein
MAICQPGHALQDQLRADGMIGSMSRKGNCWDNAPTESGFNSFKYERVFGERISTRETMKAIASESIEVFYNRKRLHSTFVYTSPVQFLKDSIGTQRGKTGRMSTPLWKTKNRGNLNPPTQPPFCAVDRVHYECFKPQY